MDKAIVGVLLAAGSSRRFGADKLTRRLPEGGEVAVRACQNLRAGVDQVLAAVRPGDLELAQKLLAVGAEIIVCPDAGRGMGASLACGVRASSPQTLAWLVALADMPWIKPATIQAVAQAMRCGADLAAPCWQGRRGHPVGFAARHRAALSALDGDAGAKSVIDAHAERLRLIDVDDPGVVRDIDRPEDLLFV
jgi:molybdenum cofactor cytidylyltransferase